VNQTIKGFIKKEFVQAVRDPRMKIMLFAMPVIQMILFGLALSNEVRNIRLLVVRAPGDIMAAHIEERAFASDWFVPAHDRGRVDPFDAIQFGEADAVLIAPPEGLTESIQRGRGRAQLLVDASNAVRGRAIETYMSAVLREATGDGGAIESVPVPFDVRMLYNPTMETSIYMVPGVMCMILCLMTLVLTSMSITREKELGTLETLIAAPVKVWEVIAGKTIPYVIIGLLDVPLVLGVGMMFFGVPLRGAIWELALASLLFVCAAVGLGTLVSTYAKNQQQAMMAGFLVMFPAIQLSGIMYPLDNVPWAIKWITYLNPLKYFVELIRNILLKGGDVAVLWKNLGALAALTAIMVSAAFRRFHRTLN
jgi:ABC-2 type transport system permease protein